MGHGTHPSSARLVVAAELKSALKQGIEMARGVPVTPSHLLSASLQVDPTLQDILKQLGIDAAQICEQLGAGEILLNCIDRDGTNMGFDIELINAVHNAVSIPVIASSGAGCVEHFYDVFTATEAESALAAGIFHRKEVPISEVKHYLKGKVAIRI